VRDIIVGKIVVSCAGDSELAKQVYDYLHPQVPNLTIIEDEIEVSGASKKQVNDLLGSFIKSKNLQDYSVIEFGDVLTLGIEVSPAKVGMVTCEYCGWFTPYLEEMHTHKLMHVAWAP
jgi:hypothetical protein